MQKRYIYNADNVCGGCRAFLYSRSQIDARFIGIRDSNEMTY